MQYLGMLGILIAMFLLNYYTLQKASLLYFKSLQARGAVIKLTAISLAIAIIFGAVEKLGSHGAVDAENTSVAFSIVQSLIILFVELMINQKFLRTKDGLRISIKDAFIIFLLQMILSILIVLVLALVLMVLVNNFAHLFISPSVQ